MARPDPDEIASMMGPPEADEQGESDTKAAARDLVKALGLDPEKVDLEGVEEALESFCMMAGR